MFAGIDLGSRQVKIVILDQNKQIVGRYLGSSMDFYRQRGKMAEGRLMLDLTDLPGILTQEIKCLVATGYGRETVKLQNGLIIPEIKAHVQGAAYLSGEKNFTLLDLGGQDSKVALVKRGCLVDFATNDKCAASTGRYLENMAAVLQISLAELALYDQDPVELNSTCAIFGETELIGKIVEGYALPNLAAGVNYTIFKRIKPLLSRLLSDKLIFTGGVAQNQALVRILERELQIPVLVLPEGTFAGAWGCALKAASWEKERVECELPF